MIFDTFANLVHTTFDTLSHPTCMKNLYMENNISQFILYIIILYQKLQVWKYHCQNIYLWGDFLKSIVQEASTQLPKIHNFINVWMFQWLKGPLLRIGLFQKCLFYPYITPISFDFLASKLKKSSRIWVLNHASPP